MSQVKKNFIYNIIYQILTLLLPLIVTPYVSRVLGVNGVGVYSYTYSIVYYFILIAMLGINNYGNRSIAKVRDNKDELSKTFVCIYKVQVTMSILMILLYVLYILIFDIQYKIFAIVQGIYLIATLFDINWFFFGLEKFKLTVTRNILIKIISVIFIFVFVNTENDLLLYIIILACSNLFSNLLLLPFLLKEIDIIKVNFSDIKVHIKPIIILFIPVIAISLYKVMDKVMIGLVCDVSEVGLYEQAEKITQMPLSLIIALGTVMMPKISNLFSKNKINEILKYISKSIKFEMFLCFPIVFGLISISEKFVPLFLGNEFSKSYILLDILSITLIFICFANVLRTQYLIPNNRDKEYIISVVIGAFVNLIINLLLIPKYASIGACVGTVTAEFSVMFFQTMVIRKELPIKNYIRESIPFLLKSILMFIIIYPFNFFNMNDIVRIIIQIITGCIVYIILNIKYIFSIINFNEILNRIMKIIHNTSN